MTPKHLVKPLALAATLAAPLLVDCASETPIAPDDPTARGLAPAVTYALRVSTNANRSGSTSLSGAHPSGKVYIFTNPDTSVDAVTFFLDGQNVRNDPNPRFDFVGTNGNGNAKSWDADAVAAGSHTIRADVKLLNGSTTTVSAAFTTGGGGTPPPPPPTGSIAIQPGQSIQSIVNANASGKTFLLKAGLHRRQSVTPKSGQTFIGENGAVMDGENVTAYAFVGTPSNPNVTIRNLEIRNYASSDLTGAIRAGNFLNQPGATGWRIEDSDIHHNRFSGIMTGNGVVIRNNVIHHNHQTNITGYGSNVLIENNEISYANYLHRPDPILEVAGIKMKKTQNVTVRNNHVHHNGGKGVWFDTDNIDLLIEGNRIEDNHGAGILHEIGYRGIIRNNQIRRNGFGEPGFSWLWFSGITVANSSNVEVHNNTIEDNIDGIGGVQQIRGSGRFGPWTLANFYVHDNMIVMRTNRQWTSHSGSVQDVGSQAVFAAGNVRFVRNHYHVYGSKNDWFRWKDGLWTWAQWRAAGQDAGGTFAKH